MKTIKSIVCIVLSLLMVLSVVACGDAETPSDISSTPADNSDVVDVSSEDGLESEEDEVTSEEDEVSSEEDEVSSEEDEVSSESETSSKKPTSSKDETSSKKPTSSKDETSSKKPTSSKDETSSKAPTSNKETSLTWKEVKKTLPKDASGKTIEIMEWNAQTPMNKKVCEKFTKETGIKVKYTVEGYSSYMPKIAGRVAAASPPTVARLRDNVPEYMKAMQPIQNTGYNFNDTYWDKDLLDAYTFDGKTYGVGLKNTPYYQPVVTYYNQELIDKYDIDDPYELWKDGKWTWDKMFELCEDFLEEAGDKYFGLTPLFGEYVYATGNTYVKFENGKFVNNLSSQGVIKGMQFLNDAHKEGLVTDETCLRDDFNLGKGLFLFDAEIGARTGHYYVRELKNKGTLRCVPVPEVKGQKDYYVCISEFEAYGIVNTIDKVDKSYKESAKLAPYFLRYYLDADNYDMNKFYSHKSFLEVVNWTRQYEGIPTYFSLWQSGMPAQTWKSEKSQIQQILASEHIPYITGTVNVANAELKKLVK